MALTQQEKDAVVNGLASHWSRLWTTIGISRQDLIAGVDSTDTWIENNQAGYNAALPTNVQNGLTADQKTLLFCAVALARVSLGFLRGLLPE